MPQTEKTTPKTTTFDELLRPLEEAIAEIEANRTIHHRETLSFMAFVRLLLYYSTSENDLEKQDGQNSENMRI